MNGYGTDAATANGLDSLDHKILAHIARLLQNGIKPVALELGGAQGNLSIEMAKQGAQVIMIDQACDAQSKFEAAAKEFGIPRGELEFRQQSFSLLASQDIPNQLHLLIAQRSLHYIEFGAATELLSRIRNRMAAKGKVFLSLAGSNTSFGKAHPYHDLPIENRFGRLAPKEAQAMQIFGEITTYSLDEAHRLLSAAGFLKIKGEYSKFGNVRAWATNSPPHP